MHIKSTVKKSIVVVFLSFSFRCLQNEAAEAASPCSVVLLGVQMGKALRRVTQSGVQLVLVGGMCSASNEREREWGDSRRVSHVH